MNFKKTLKSFVFIGFLSSLFLFSGVCYASTQGFEGYATGTDLKTQTGWHDLSGSMLPNWARVVSNPTHGGSIRAMSVNDILTSSGFQIGWDLNGGAGVENGDLSVYFRPTNIASNTDGLTISVGNARIAMGYPVGNGGTIKYSVNGVIWNNLGTYTANNWYKVDIQWRTGTQLVRFQFNDEGFTAWTSAGIPTAPTMVAFAYARWLNQYHYYIDDITLNNPPATVEISSPANGSTITDLATHITGTYSGFDPLMFHAINLSFTSGALGLSTTNQTISPIPAGGAGTFDYLLSDFDLLSNGTFNFKSNAIFRNTQLSDMLQTSDLTSPAGYHLILDVSGLATPYSFESFPTWYIENAAGGYSYPSDFASSIVGFIQPIFEKAANFTNQSLLYFNKDNAYDKGQQLGSVFPITQAYLNKINIFFGGFPLIQFFEFLIIVMLGIFTIRTIFKFIPFFG